MEKRNSTGGKGAGSVSAMLKGKASVKSKIVIAVVVLVVLIILLFFVLNPTRSNGNQVQAQNEMTDEVTKRSLVKSVGATGTVISIESKELSTSLANVEVAEVLVEVGDVVAAGDKLLVFDTSDIETNLETAEADLNTAQQKNSISASDAARSVSDAERTRQYQVDVAETTVSNAASSYETAVADYDESGRKLEDLKAEEEAVKVTYEETESALTQAEQSQAEKQKAFDKAQNDYTSYIAKDGFKQEKADTKKAAMETAQTELAEEQSNYKEKSTENATAKTEYETAKKTREQYEDTVKELQKQVTSQKNSYDAAVKDYGNTVESQASSVASAKSSQSSTNISTNTNTEKKQVNEYEKQLKKGILTAPFAGIITAVNYKEGDIYAGGGVILTIQDSTTYEIEAEIGEYDISDVELGQSVLIKTNATGEDQLEGTISYISPTATTDATGMISSDITYKVRISLNAPVDRLRLDMSASISVIMEEHDDVLTVPYSAVETDEDGNSFINEVAAEGAEDKKIMVTVVMESNYYTEIQSEDIFEGQKVRVIESEEAGTDAINMNDMRGGF